MSKILIIETSAKPNQDRFIGNVDEWTQGWSLLDGNSIAIKEYNSTGDTEINYLKDNVGNIEIDFKKNYTIWIRRKEEDSEFVEVLKKIIEPLSAPSCKVYYAYHDGTTIKDSIETVSDKQYSLSATKEQNFSGIIINDDEQKRLNKDAPFGVLFSCFFLTPDCFPSLFQRIVVPLSAIYLDINTLIECNFNNDCISSIRKTYNNPDAIVNTIRSSREDMLKLIIEIITNCNDDLTRNSLDELKQKIGDTDFNIVGEVFGALNNKDHNVVTTNRKQYEKWFRDLIDNLHKVGHYCRT